jgi:hypothetical protein
MVVEDITELVAVVEEEITEVVAEMGRASWREGVWA